MLSSLTRMNKYLMLKKKFLLKNISYVTVSLHTWNNRLLNCMLNNLFSTSEAQSLNSTSYPILIYLCPLSQKIYLFPYLCPSSKHKVPYCSWYQLHVSEEKSIAHVYVEPTGFTNTLRNFAQNFIFCIWAQARAINVSYSEAAI